MANAPTLSNLPMRLRTLLALLVAVLLSHWLALSDTGSVWSLQPAPSASAMNTRVVPAPPAPESKSESPPVAIPAPQPVTPIPAKPVVAKPAKKPPQVPKNEPNQPVAQENNAQAATVTIASTEPSAQDTTPTQATASMVINDPPMQSTGSSPEPALPPRAAVGDAPPGVKAQFPASGKFGYAATSLKGGQPQSGSGTLQWSSDGKDYQLQLEVPFLFVTALRQASVGTISADGLMPTRYVDKRINRSEVAAHFNRDGLANITFSGNQPSAPMMRGAQDRLSVLVQLAGMAAGQPERFAPGASISVQVASTEEADVWLFNVQAEEAVQVPAGSTTALHLVRSPRKEFDARLEVWMAPSLGYLPVRIKQTEQNGNYTDLQLRTPSLSSASQGTP
jgi:hypothetical protein